MMLSFGSTDVDSAASIVCAHLGESSTIKRRKTNAFQEQRRNAFLSRQQELRQHRADLSRRIWQESTDDGAQLAEEDMQVETTPTESRKIRKKNNMQHKYRDLLQILEYFIEPPLGFSSGMLGAGGCSQWLVASKPAGTRCLVISSMGKTTGRTIDGAVIETFQSLLPGGSLATTPGTPQWASGNGNCGSSKKMFTILDCILCGTTGCYYVLDVLNWKGYPLCDCTAEFRFYWLTTKFSDDCSPALQIKSTENERAVVPMSFLPVSPDSLEFLYHGTGGGYLRDGLLFYHKDGHYENGLSPLALLWQERDMVQKPISASTGGQGGLEAVLEFKQWPTESSPVDTDVHTEDIMVNTDGCKLNNAGLFSMEGYLIHQFHDSPPTYLSSDEDIRDGDVVYCSHRGIERGGTVQGSCLKELCVINKLGNIRSQCSRSVIDSWSKLLFIAAIAAGEAVSIQDLIVAAAE